MRNKLFTIAVVYFVLVIVVAHFFAPPNYTFVQNTISELASQGYVFKGVMQLGLIGFGFILLVGVFRYFKKNYRLCFLIFIALYGMSILLSGIYCTAPIDPGIAFSIQESKMHSLFATIAGISMSLGILWQVFTSLNERERWMRIVFLMLIGGLSGIFGLIENGSLLFGQGIVQRVLYLVGLIWLVYEEQMLLATKEIS